MSLKDKAQKMNSGNGIEFMDNRTKGNIKSLNDKIVEVIDYDFLSGDDGKYLVFITRQDPEHFYFGATVMTDNFSDFTAEDKQEIQSTGIPILLADKQNKKGNRTYQSITFYPESN